MTAILSVFMHAQEKILQLTEAHTNSLCTLKRFSERACQLALRAEEGDLLTSTSPGLAGKLRKAFLGISLLSIAMLFANQSEGQPRTISGTLINGEILQKATVELYNKDSVLLRSQIPDQKGYFRFSNVDKNVAMLVISCMGFNTYLQRINPEYDIDLGHIELTTDKHTLQTVFVKGRKGRFNFEKGKLTFNIDETLRKSSINAFQLMQKAPGVEVRNDNLTLDGRSGILVILNGRQVFSGMQEALKYVSSLSADDLRAIEINFNPSAKYDKSVNGIVNIILKKDSSQGVKGTVQGYANTGQYANDGTSINLNYTKKKLYAYATLKSDDEKGYTEGNNTVTSQPMIDLYREDYETRNSPHQQFIRSGLDYSLTSNSSVSIVAEQNRKTQKQVNIYDLTFYDALHRTDSIIHVIDTTHAKQARFFLNVNYKALFDSTGHQTLNIDLTHLSDKPEMHSLFTHSYFNQQGNTTRRRYILKSEIRNVVSINGAVIDYTRKLKQNIDLSAGLKLARTETNNDATYDSLAGHSYDNDLRLSSKNSYREKLFAAYLALERFTGTIGINAGLRFESAAVSGQTSRTEAKMTKTFRGLYPNFLASYNINNTDQIMITASKAVIRPTFDQLFSYIRYVNPTFYLQGNQNLEQYNTYILSLKYVLKNMYTATLRYDYARNYIPQTLLMREDKNSVTKSSYINAANLSGFQLTLNIPILINEYWSIYNYINGFYTRSTAKKNLYKGLDFTNANVYYQLSQSFILPKGYYTELSFGYVTATRVNQQTTKPLYTLDLNITKSYFNERLKCSLNLSDIFSSNRSKGNTVYNNTLTQFYRFEDTRRIGLSCSYDFGSHKIKSREQRQNGVADEINRIKN